MHFILYLILFVDVIDLIVSFYLLKWSFHQSPRVAENHKPPSYKRLYEIKTRHQNEIQHVQDEFMNDSDCAEARRSLMISSILVNIAFGIFYQIHVSFKKTPLWGILIKPFEILLPVSASLMRRQRQDVAIADHICEFAAWGGERDVDQHTHIYVYTRCRAINDYNSNNRLSFR